MEDIPFDDDNDQKDYLEWLNKLDEVSRDHIARTGLTTRGFWSLHKEIEAEKQARQSAEANPPDRTKNNK